MIFTVTSGMGEDDVGLLFDRGAISAFEWAVVVLASEELKGDAASKAADALKDEAHKDERTGCRKSDDEVAALARVLMGESEA